jgi:sugar lactone lactonase YvrE
MHACGADTLIEVYFNDSGAQRTFAYDFDVSTGNITNRRVLIDHSSMGGKNDGEVMNDGMVIEYVVEDFLT